MCLERPPARTSSSPETPVRALFAPWWSWSIIGFDLLDDFFWKGAAWYPRQDGCIFSSNALQLMLILAIQPELRCHATQPFKTHRHFRCKASTAGQDPVKHLTRDFSRAAWLTDTFKAGST